MTATLHPKPYSGHVEDHREHRGLASGDGGGPPRSTVTPLRAPTDVHYVTALGPWTFTRQTTMDFQLIAEFYDLYTLAFEPLKTRSVARQVLTWAEFFDQMVDERVVKYVARNDAGEALGLTTLTNELESVPWISPEYFAAHYPEQWARHAVYYLGFTLAHPSQRHLRFVETIIGVGLQGLADEQAVVAYDVCAFNNLELRFNDRITSALKRFPTAHLELVDTQYYSCVTFS
jgi:hypothetical protein